jgi:hypothetical protein
MHYTLNNADYRPPTNVGRRYGALPITWYDDEGSDDGRPFAMLMLTPF